MFLAVGFVSVSINPIINAACYEVFRHSLRKMLKKDNVVATTTI